MQPVGHVLIKPEFKATKIWPGEQWTLQGIVNLEKEYKEALAGKLVTVMEKSKHDGSYLVLGKTKDGGAFIWMIEAEDTVDGSFLQVIWKYGQLIPAGLTPIQEFEFLAKAACKNTKYHTS